MICKIYIFLKFIWYNIRRDEKTQMLETCPSEKIKVAKNAPLFLPWAGTHHSFTFNLQFFYKLKQISKGVCDIFDYWFYLIIIKVYIPVLEKAFTIWL